MLAPMLRRSVALAFRQGNLAAFTPLITSVRSFSTHKSPEDYPDLAGHEDHEHWTLEKELSKGDHYYVDDRRQMTRMSKNDERIDPTSHPASRYRMVPLWMAHESTLYERDPPEKSAAQTKKKSAIKVRTIAHSMLPPVVLTPTIEMASDQIPHARRKR